MLLLTSAFTAHADYGAGWYNCTDVPLPNPGSDSTDPKSIEVLYNGNPLTTFLPRCVGSWTRLEATGGNDLDIKAAPEIFCNNACQPQLNCADLWANYDNNYSWNITGAQEVKGPFGEYNEVVYIKAKTTFGSIYATVSRSECAAAQDATPIAPKTAQIFAYFLPGAWEKYPKASAYSGISISNLDTILSDASIAGSFYDEFGVDPCQSSPSGIGCDEPDIQSYIFQNYGVHCCYGLRMKSNPTYTSFSSYLGQDLSEINTQFKYSIIFGNAIPGNVKLVNSITFCGGILNPDYIGCAIVGSDHIVFDKDYISQAHVIIHEWGHTAFLQHLNNDPLVETMNFMHKTSTNSVINSGQCMSLGEGTTELVWP